MYFLEIRAQTIARLEERIRESRDERLKLERSHDERMAAIKRQLNEVLGLYDVIEINFPI